MPSDLGLSLLGQLVDHADPRTQARDTRESCSNPLALGQGPGSPGTAGRDRMPSELGASPPAQLVKPTGLGPERELLGRAGRPRGNQTQARVARECWSTPQALEPGPTSPGTYGRAPGTTGMGPRLPGQLVESAGHWSRAQVAQECGSTLRALEPWPESPESAGPPCRTSDQSPSRLGSSSTLRVL